MVEKNKNNSDLAKEDSSLWQRFCHNIISYRSAKEPPVPAQYAIPTTSIDSQHSVPLLQKIPPSSKLLPNMALDKNLAKRMRTGNITIHANIDLHGMTEHQAHLAFNHFITQSYAMGKRNLLVITGKGKNSPSQGVLKEALPKWLAMPEIVPIILAYCSAAPKDGGSGAWYIVLRKNKK